MLTSFRSYSSNREVPVCTRQQCASLLLPVSRQRHDQLISFKCSLGTQSCNPWKVPLNFISLRTDHFIAVRFEINKSLFSGAAKMHQCVWSTLSQVIAWCCQTSHYLDPNWPKLVQVMPCHLTTPSHYFNQGLHAVKIIPIIRLHYETI